MRKRIILAGVIVAALMGGIAFITGGSNDQSVATAQPLVGGNLPERQDATWSDPIWADYQMSFYLNHEVVENESPATTEALGKLLSQIKFAARYVETVSEREFYVIRAEKVTFGDKFFPDCRWLTIKPDGIPAPLNQDAFNLEAELIRLRARS